MATDPNEMMLQLAEAMSRLTETMDLHSAVLIKTNGSGKDLDEILNRMGKTVDKADQIYQKAAKNKEEEDRKRQYSEAMRESATREGTASLRSFASAVRDTTEGLGKYNEIGRAHV